MSHEECLWKRTSVFSQPLLNKYYFRGLRKTKDKIFFITWNSPHNLRGVPQAHKGELVEPPGANVPNLHWAPFPLVHNLLPGVAIWRRENRVSMTWSLVKTQKTEKKLGAKQKKIQCFQRLTFIPFRKYLKTWVIRNALCYIKQHGVRPFNRKQKHRA